MIFYVKQRPEDCNVCPLFNNSCVLQAAVYDDCPLQIVEDRSQKALDSMLKCANKGQWQGGRPPYGYYVRNGQFAIDWKKADTVRYIFQSCVDGKTVNFIKDELNKIIFRASPKGGKWTYARVKYILTNPRYCGDMCFNVQHRKSFKNKSADEIVRIEGAFKGIISRELFDKAQQRLIEQGVIKN